MKSERPLSGHKPVTPSRIVGSVDDDCSWYARVHAKSLINLLGFQRGATSNNWLHPLKHCGRLDEALAIPVPRTTRKVTLNDSLTRKTSTTTANQSAKVSRDPYRRKIGQPMITMLTPKSSPLLHLQARVLDGIELNYGV